MTAHTFLFEPARWQADGIFIDPAGQTLPMAGHTVILHGEGIWSLTGKIHLTGEATVEIVNDYRIIPFPPGELQTTWTSHNQAFGTLKGRFVVIGNTILSSFDSDDRQFHGTEWLRRLDADNYENRGVLFAGERLLSAWAADLRREACCPRRQQSIAVAAGRE
jgi:hypothetical protein